MSFPRITKAYQRHVLLSKAIPQRDLDLLKAIDQTIEALAKDKSMIDLMAEVVRDAISSIGDARHRINAKNKVIPLFEQSRGRFTT